MGLHEQAHAVLMKPSTSVTVAQLHEIHRPVVFVGPIIVLDAADAYIHKNNAARAKQGHHTPVWRTDVSITVARITIGKHTLEVSPLFDHTGK
jgi:hypothetical protein